MGSVIDLEGLGRQLGISPEKIAEPVQCTCARIQCTCGLEKVVQEWLRIDKTASWKKLTDALEQCGYEAETVNNQEQYHTPPQSHGKSVGSSRSV